MSSIPGKWGTEVDYNGEKFVVRKQKREFITTPSKGPPDVGRCLQRRTLQNTQIPCYPEEHFLNKICGYDNNGIFKYLGKCVDIDKGIWDANEKNNQQLATFENNNEKTQIDIFPLTIYVLNEGTKVSEENTEG